MAQQKTKINLGSRYSKDDREAIAAEIINHIQERSAGGKGINPETMRNKKFVRYSKSYAKVKGRSSPVDLTVSGEMLAAMRLLNQTSRSVTIGYEDGSEWNDRAEGNQKGSYGGSPDPSRARPFLGISNADLRRILENYDEVEE